MRRWLKCFPRVALGFCVLCFPAPTLYAQDQASSQPEEALAQAFTAACRQDQMVFARYLTARNAAALTQMSDAERAALLQRFVLLKGAGKPLLSTGADGRTVVRCDAGGVVSEMRLGKAESSESISFIPVEIPQASAENRSVRFGLVREGTAWKLLSVGLLLLDLPTMAHQWAQNELEARETQAMAHLRKMAEALRQYQEAYGKLPESLEQLGPPDAGGTSPERAGLLEASLAAEATATYRFRYVIVPAVGGLNQSERNKIASFVLTATPVEYGKSGRRSFYLHSSGILRGADKHGAVATDADPRLSVPSP
jgi:hypothetical protein